MITTGIMLALLAGIAIKLRSSVALRSRTNQPVRSTARALEAGFSYPAPRGAPAMGTAKFRRCHDVTTTWEGGLSDIPPIPLARQCMA
jgi:hypothetical protein